jgi:hypothetical protein
MLLHFDVGRRNLLAINVRADEDEKFVLLSCQHFDCRTLRLSAFMRSSKSRNKYSETLRLSFAALERIHPSTSELTLALINTFITLPRNFLAYCKQRALSPLTSFTIQNMFLSRKTLYVQVVEPSESIMLFIHCRKCIDEAKRVEVSPADYARLHVGVEGKVLSVMCSRHDEPVADFELAKEETRGCDGCSSADHEHHSHH